MSIPVLAPLTRDSQLEGPILRNSVNEIPAREQEASSPRTELLSPTSPLDSNDGAAGDSRPSRRSRHRISERRKRQREDAYSTTPQPELIKRLVEHEYEVLKLRKELQAKTQRLQAESQRVAELERERSETETRFRLLNESRLASQKEAIAAKQELDMYKFQLDTARSEATRAQQTVALVERQRDEAEASASRARDKARKLHQERLVDAAREEGRRFGFEAGFQRAQEESQIRLPRRSQQQHFDPPAQRAATNGRDRSFATGDDAACRERLNQQVQEVVDDDDDDLTSGESSPVELRNPNGQPSPPALMQQSRSTPPRAPSEPQTTNVNPQQPPGQTQRPPSRENSPPITVYAIDIPPNEELARSYNTNEPEYHTEPQNKWVTAQQYRELYGHEPSPPQSQPGHSNAMPPLHPGVDNPSQSAMPPQPALRSFVPPPAPQPWPMHPLQQQQQWQRPQPSSKGVKFTASIKRPSLAKTRQQASSWYRSFSFRKKAKPKVVIDPIDEEDKPAPAAATTESEQLYKFEPPPRQSWYQSKQPSNPARSVRSRDYAYPKNQAASVDSLATYSTRLSDMALVNDTSARWQVDPPDFPGAGVVGSAASARSSAKKGKGKESSLSLIKEHPSSRGNTPSADMNVAGPSRPRASSDAMYSEVRSTRSVAPLNITHGLRGQSSKGSMPPSDRPPPRQYQRPANLTVPAPLAPQSLHTQFDGQPTSVDDNVLRAGPSNYGPGASLGPPSQTPTTGNLISPGIGINVEPPSQSPSTAGLDRQSSMHLSPNHGKAPLPHVTPDSQYRSRNGIPQNSQYGQAFPSVYAGAGPSPMVNSVSLPGEMQPSSSKPASIRQRSPAPSNRPLSVQSNRYPASLVSKGPSHAKSISDNQQGRANQPYPSTSRPESVRSSASRLVRTNAGMTPAAVGGATLPAPDKGLSRIASNASLRTMGSYARFEPSEYQDPAFWGMDDRPSAQQASSAEINHAGIGVPIRVRSRAASTASGLSYVTDKQLVN